MAKNLNASGLGYVLHFRHALPSLCWSILIFGLHAIPGSDLDLNDWTGLFHFDKLMHLAMFAVLSSSTFIALGKSGSIRRYKFWAISGLAFFGVSLELAQDLWFLEREASVMDLIADVLGVFVGRLAFRLIYGCWN